MIFFVGNNGTVIKTVPSSVNQGAVNSNIIYLVAPYSPDLSVTVRFQLPNGVWTKPAFMRNGVDENSSMTSLGALVSGEGTIVDKKTGNVYAVWSYALGGDITRNWGTVTAQFFFWGENSEIFATSAVNFTVNRGVPEGPLPDPPSEKLWPDILDYLQTLRTAIGGGDYPARSFVSWKQGTVYSSNEYIYYPNWGEYGALVMTKNATSQPPFSNGQLNSQDWELIADFNEIKRAFVLWGFNEGQDISDLEWIKN